jgi:uncharacterized membrane protein YfhO
MGWREPPLDSAADDAAEVVRRDDERIELRVVTAADRLLVVNVAAFPGWGATVDDRSAVIVRTNGLVQGIHIPPGKHRVMLQFEPTGFWWGVFTATVALFGVSILAFPRRLAWASPEAEERAPDR